MMIRLNSVIIKAFRGIVDSEFRLEGKNLLLKGDNGTGKSSFVDALEFFFTGEVSHLRGTEGITFNKHAPHVNYKKNDLTVSVNFLPDDITLLRTINTKFLVPTSLETFFSNHKTGLFILRRHQLLEFILSKPSERFTSIGNLIGIGTLDPIELNMQRVQDKFEGELIGIENQISELTEKISVSLNHKINKSEEINLQLNQILTDSKYPQVDLDSDLADQLEGIFKLSKMKKKQNEFLDLKVIQKQVERVKFQNSLFEDIDSLNKLIDKNKDKYLLKTQKLYKFLQEGKLAIEEDCLENCPICEQPIYRENVLKSLFERLKVIEGLSNDASQIRTLARKILLSLTNLKTEFKNFSDEIDKKEIFEKENLPILEINSFFTDITNWLNSVQNLGDDLKQFEIKKIKRFDEEFLFRVHSWVNKLFQELKLDSEEICLLKIIVLIQDIYKNREQLKKLEKAKLRKTKEFKIASEIFNSFTTKKKEKIQQIYEEIQSDLDRMYSTIHPGEDHSNIKLQIISERRASTRLLIDSFKNEREDPRAFSSEGHLDSLGLCIFLAFSKIFCENSTLLILDDIVTTIDSKHRKNICDVLFKEFSAKQTIITTHDELWYEELCGKQQAMGIVNEYKRLEIISWNKDVGPELRPHLDQWKKIEGAIKNGEKQISGNLGRQYLEWILSCFCNNSEAPVPYKSSNIYMVNDFFPSAKKRIQKLIKDENERKNILKRFEELESNLIMGNLMSHNSLLAKKTSMKEVSDFCFSVKNLQDVLICSTCKSFLKYYRDLKILRCPTHNCSNPMELKTK